MLLYSLLFLSGYNLSLADIKDFRQLGSKTPGHPERGSHRVWRQPPVRSGRDSATGMIWPASFPEVATSFGYPYLPNFFIAATAARICSGGVSELMLARYRMKRPPSAASEI